MKHFAATLAVFCRQRDGDSQFGLHTEVLPESQRLRAFFGKALITTMAALMLTARSEIDQSPDAMWTGLRLWCLPSSSAGQSADICRRNADAHEPIAKHEACQS